MHHSVYETKTCNVWHIRNTWANICCLQANPAKNKTQTQLSSLLQTAELLQQGYRLATTVIPFEDLDPKMLYTRLHCLYLSIIEYMHNGTQAFLKQQNLIQQHFEKQVDVLKIFNIPNNFTVDHGSSLVSNGLLSSRPTEWHAHILEDIFVDTSVNLKRV